ncbi:MAG: Crp/Fnr family transcriptional regulator [Alistipes finegoldii]
MEFTEILCGRYGLSVRAAGVLMRHASQSVHARKEIIVEEGQRDQEIRFVTEGSARSYGMREDKCVILSFAFEGDPTSSTLGAWPGGISGHTIETMEPTTLVRLPREEIDRLFAADAELADWGRRMRRAAAPARGVFRRLRMARQERAVQAHAARIPQLLQRIALKDLAAYLFVTPQSLSRIRAEIK